MALSPQQLDRVKESRQSLAAMSPDQNREVARWLRDDVAPELPTDRQRELAEQSARRFEQRAGAAASD